MTLQPSSNSASHLPAMPWREERVSRVVLGTAQFGMDYGIANTQGRPDARKAAAIIETAWANGIRHFDTAQSYGESEAVLGQALRDVGVAAEARINSKLSVALDPTNVQALAEAVEGSFDRLGTDRLWCMMLHRPFWLDHWDQGLGHLLRSHHDAGRFGHLGVSLLGPDDAPRCLSHPELEVLQVACNPWDRRILGLRVLETARNNGKLCCIRSIYLQGLLMLSPDVVADRLPAARQAATRWHDLTERFGIRPVELAIRFAMGLEAPLVVGADSPGQLCETVRLARREPLPQEIIDALAETLDPVVDETILDPRLWNRP